MKSSMNGNASNTAERDIVTDMIEFKKAKEEMVAWKNQYELLIATSGQLVYEYHISTGDMIWGARLETGIRILA